MKLKNNPFKMGLPYALGILGILLGGIIIPFFGFFGFFGFESILIITLSFGVIGFFIGWILQSLFKQGITKKVVGGGVVGFLVPWVIFYIMMFSCKGTGCGDWGMAVPIFVVFSIISLLIGSIIGLSISNKTLFILNLIICMVIWTYFFIRVINYYNTPLYNRGADGVGILILPLLIINLILIIISSIVSFIFRRKK